jgi:hypothetical protein
MTIDKALEKLQDKLNHGEGSHESELETAIRLGVEALKRIKYYREELERNKILKVHLLPGETED